MAVQELLTVLKVKTDQYLQGFNSATKAAQNFGKELDNVGSKLEGIGTKLTAALTLPVAGFIGASVSARADMQKLEMGLNSVTGSAEETARQLVRLKEIAKLPGLSLSDATRASINLQAVGVESTKAERYIKGFGNALAVVGKGAADLNPVITQLVQMSTKSKVVAGDLRPIMDAVPQVAAIIKQHFGTIDTEALQKMGVSTQEFTEVLLNGLEKLPQAGSGISNSFENLKDTITNTFAEIGRELEPRVQRILNLLNSWADKGQKLVDWFHNLSETQQDVVIGIAAFVAAIGPALLAIGALAQVGATISTGLAVISGGLKAISTGFAFLGGLSAATLAWAAAIAVAAAALVGLGVWVYNHWTQIVGTLQQAWAGFSEFFAAVWTKMSDPVSLFAKGIINHWDTIKAVSIQVWNTISAVVGSVFNGIKSVAVSVFNWLYSTSLKIVETFKSWNIPGFDKLLTLNKTWDELGKTAEAAGKKGADALGKLSGNQGTATNLPAFVPHETEKKAKQKKEFEWFDAGKALSPMEIAKAIDSNLKGQASKLLAEIAKEALSAKKSVDEFGQGFEQLTTTTNTSLVPSLDATQIKLAQITTDMTDYGAAIKRMGITTTATLQANAYAAEKDFNTIAQGIGTVDEIRQAYMKWAEATIKLKAARGEDVTDLVAGLKRAQQEIDQASGKAATRAKKPMQEVSSILSNLNQDIAGAIVKWQGFGSVVVSVVQSIGKAIVAEILQKMIFTEERMGMIADKLGGLLGKVPGLDSVFGKATKTITDNAAAATKAVGNVASKTTSTVAKTASSALSSAVSMATGIVSAVSGVIGNFQMAGIGKDLGRVEVTTRGILNQLISIQNSANQYWPALTIMMGQLSSLINRGIGVFSPEQTEVRARIVAGTIASGSSGGLNAGAITLNGNFFGGNAGMTAFANELLTVLRRQGANI